MNKKYVNFELIKTTHSKQDSGFVLETVVKPKFENDNNYDILYIYNDISNNCQICSIGGFNNYLKSSRKITAKNIKELLQDLINKHKINKNQVLVDIYRNQSRKATTAFRLLGAQRTFRVNYINTDSVNEMCMMLFNIEDIRNELILDGDE